MVTSAIGWVGDLVQAIVDNKLILMFVIAGMTFFGIKMIRKLIGV